MNNTLEKYLQCHLCSSVLIKINRTFICSKSKHRFAIKQGIPILLDYSSLPIHSRKQQSHFEKVINRPTVNSFENMKQWKKQYLERFVHNFKAIRNKTIIEIGTGGGYMAISLAKLGAKVIACDITFNNLIALKRLAKTFGLESSVLLVCCSADQLPFKNNGFDYLIINAVLEHIPAEEKTIAEINRILKKGGGLMITVPMKYKYIFPPLLPLNYLHDKRIGHLRRYDDISLRIKFHDFKMKKAYFTGHPPKVIKFIVNKVGKFFNEKAMEEADRKWDGIKLWSSNVIAFLIKK